MKRPVLAVLLTAALLPSSVWADTSPGVQARTVYHGNGTHTESIQDPSIHEQKEFTYDQNNVLISKKVYLLNERGMPVQGNVYDGRDVLKARASFLYDDFGRMIEERMSNLQGEVYQSILFTYDAQGKALPPKSRTYSTHAPDMKSAVIDFTKTGDAPRPMDRKEGGPGMGNVPRLPEPTAAPQPSTKGSGDKPTDAPKKSFWNFLKKNDKKDDKK